MIAITGASGQLGRLVAETLAERGLAAKVTLGTRDPAHLGPLANAGFHIVPADFDRPETLVPLFAGSRVALVICGNAPNDVRIRQHCDATDAAKRAGVQRIVYTSFVNPNEASLFPFAKVHAATERYMQNSGLSCTFLRSNQYFENLNAALAVAQETGTLSLPGATGKVAYLARADIATATATVLAGEGHDNRHYELTGLESFDLSDVAERAANIWGRRVTAADMSAGDYRALLERRKLPTYAIDAQIGIRLASGAGEYARITNDADCLAGRPLLTMNGFLASFKLALAAN
jgi:NAD(P)H dehydrogenase (quinone)